VFEDASAILIVFMMAYHTVGESSVSCILI